MTTTVKGTFKNDKVWAQEEVVVPEDQLWQYALIMQQNNNLNTIKHILVFYLLLTLLGFLLVGCSVVLGV